MDEAKKGGSPGEILDRAEQALRTLHLLEGRRLLSQVQDVHEDAVVQRRNALWARLAPDPIIPLLLVLCLLLYVLSVVTHL